MNYDDLMNLSRSQQPADLLFCHNNSTVAVMPNPNGRLGKLVKYCSRAGMDHVWVFRVVSRVMNENDELVDDEETKDLTVGTLEDWSAFRKMCREVGVIVREGSFFAPLSNHRLRSVVNENTFDTTYVYMEEELAVVRQGLPTREQLEETIANFVGFPS